MRHIALAVTLLISLHAAAAGDVLPARLAKKHGVDSFDLRNRTVMVREMIVQLANGTSEPLRAEVFGVDEFEEVRVEYRGLKVKMRTRDQQLELIADGATASKHWSNVLDPRGLLEKYKADLDVIGAALVDVPTMGMELNLGPLDCMQAEFETMPNTCNGGSGTGPGRTGGGDHGGGAIGGGVAGGPAGPGVIDTGPECQGDWTRGASVMGAKSICCRFAAVDAVRQCNMSTGTMAGCCYLGVCDSACAVGDYGCVCGLDARASIPPNRS